MKKLSFLLLALAMLLTAGLSRADAMWVLNTGKWNDRLNLRTQPEKDASSLGRYYTGTRVEVIEDPGEWVHVLTMDRRMGFVFQGALSGGMDMPTDEEQMIKAVIGVASGGGRLIVKREKGIALEDADSLVGAVRLENPDGDATLYYTEPLAGEIDDAQAIDIASRKLKQTGETSEWAAAFVVRCVQPQWERYSLLLVDFVDAEGTVVQSVELDRKTGEVIAIGANG